MQLRVYQMKTYVFLTFFITQIAFASNPVDTTLVKYVDVTGDEIPESIELHVNANDFYSPFDWTLTIRSKDNILYSYSENDSSSENRILLEVEEGKKYEDVKRKFYFEDFVGLNIRKDINIGGGPEYLFSKTYDGSIYFVTKRYLMKENCINEKNVVEIIDKLVEKLKAGESNIVSHLERGLYSTLPMVYVEEVKKLVPIYSD